MSQKNTYKHYKSIDFLPRFNYYRIMDTDDLRYLLILDNYNDLPDIQTELLEVWADINMQLYDFSVQKNKRSEMQHKGNKQVNELKYKYEYIQNILQYLFYYKDDGMEKELASLGYRINPNKNYFNELTRIKKQSQNLTVKINLKELDVQDMNKGISGDYDHYSELNAIRRHTGLQIDEHKTSIKEYFSIRYDVIKELDKKQLKDG